MKTTNRKNDKFQISCARRRGLALVCMLCAVFCSCRFRLGQQVTAAITGKVIDPSGAAVTDAKVTATDTERGSVWPR